MHMMLSIPFAFMASACWTKPGRCFAEQVGVKAPGNPKTTLLFPLKNSWLEKFLGPPAVMVESSTDGIGSPIFIVIILFL